MNTKKTMIILFVLLCGCSLFQINESNFFSLEERDILKKTTEILDYGYGYDTQIELDYFYSYNYSILGFDKKEYRFAEIINKTDKDIINKYYDKIYRLNAMTEYKMKNYKEKKDWKYYTYIKNELQPTLEKYFSLLQKYVYKRIPSLKDDYISKNDAILKEIEKRYIKEEIVVDTF